MNTSFVKVKGTQISKMDGKGRLVIPSNLRTKVTGKSLNEKLTLTAHPWFYLMLMPISLFEEKVSQIADRPENDEAAMIYKGTFIGMADDASIDTHGRIVVPAVNRSFAGMKSEVVVVGMVDHLRLFAKEVWDQTFYREDKSTKPPKPAGWENVNL